MSDSFDHHDQPSAANGEDLAPLTASHLAEMNPGLVQVTVCGGLPITTSSVVCCVGGTEIKVHLEALSRCKALHKMYTGGFKEAIEGYGTFPEDSLGGWKILLLALYNYEHTTLPSNEFNAADAIHAIVLADKYQADAAILDALHKFVKNRFALFTWWRKMPVSPFTRQFHEDSIDEVIEAHRAYKPLISLGKNRFQEMSFAAVLYLYCPGHIFRQNIDRLDPQILLGWSHIASRTLDGLNLSAQELDMMQPTER